MVSDVKMAVLRTRHFLSVPKMNSVSIAICVWESQDRLTLAAKVLEQLTGQKPVYSKAKYTVRSFGIMRNEQTADYCTVHGARAEEIPGRGVNVQEYMLWKTNSSDTGNFGVGVQTFDAHMDLGIKYDRRIRSMAWMSV
ncbi:60S ribosomal protein L11-2 [Lemmus lemmus]